MTARLPYVALAGAVTTAGAAAALRRRLLRRPLPKVEGEIEVEGASAPLTIARDRFGVPRVEARTREDLAFGQGFCHGQDRLWQLELYRRFASGRLSELAGEEGLRMDLLTRTLGFRRRAEEEVDRVSESVRQLIEAYAAGVNAAVAEARALPFELQLLRLDPEPWTPADSLAVSKVLALGFSTNMETELFRAELVRRVGAERAARLEPPYPDGNPLVVERGGAWSGDGLTLIDQIREVRDKLGLGLQPAASNNWVVSGARSVTGRPLLAGDPHITTSIPDVWYQIELSAPGIELRGGSFPHYPGVVTGQTREVAWAFTNAMADVQDLFVERVRENGGGPEYEFEGQWLPVEVRHEDIRVRGRREPERVEVRETHHGPILNGPLGAEGDDPLALAWTALREPCLTDLAMDVGAVATGQEAVERFEAYTAPVMNMLWADRGGNIGYKLIGKLPVRRGGCPDVPKPGWTGEYEWDGYVPYEELPAIVNPPAGVLVSANNQVAPDDYPHHITSDYLDGYRAARIAELLAEQERHSLEDFERMQTDVHSIPGEITARRLTGLDPPEERERRAIERLEHWDHRLDAGTVAGTIYKAFTVHFARAVSEAAIGDPDFAERWRSKSLVGFTPMTASPWRFHSHLLDLWEEGDPDVIGGRSWDELALESLSAALDDLEQRHGSDPEGWRWGKVHGVRFAHPLGDGDTVASRRLDGFLSRRLEAGGGQETVCAIGFVPHDGDYTGIWGPSYRLLADLEDRSRTRWQHMTGQSGHPGSPHYDDLLDDWLAGRTNPVAQPPVATLRLEPA